MTITETIQARLNVLYEQRRQAQGIDARIQELEALLRQLQSGSDGIAGNPASIDPEAAKLPPEMRAAGVQTNVEVLAGALKGRAKK